MPIILSLSYANDTLYAAGPEGLFRLENGELVAIPQPESELACCSAVDHRVLVGGAPHGVAYTLADQSWQAGWMDGVSEPVYCLAPDPQVALSGVVLAGSAGGGVLRSHNRGQSWTVCNFGLQEYNVLSLAWAPVAEADRWPRWEVVFAGTEQGLYRSPNAGRGWKRSEGIEGVVQSLAVADDFHSSGLVLAGTEENGLWRSKDHGRTFSKVTNLSSRINALAYAKGKWWMSDAESLWQSLDGESWREVTNTPALTLLATPNGLWMGGEQGVAPVQA